MINLEDNDNSNIENAAYSILIVDDDLVFANKLKNFLSGKYIINIAGNGYEAINKIKEMERPDLIISDINMPIMDGHVFLEELSKFDNYYLIPFIFVISNNSEEDLIKSREIGVVDYIIKPFNDSELIVKIESLINKEYDF